VSLNDRIREARKNKNLTQEQLGALIGVAKTTIAGYEKNREPTAAKIGEIADVLGVDANYLLQDEFNTYKETHANMHEMSLIKKYRGLDDHGKEMVDIVLDKEAERVKSETTAEQEKPTAKIIPLYLSPAAAGYTSPVMGEDYEDYEVPANSEADYAVRIDGDSMEPYIKDKSVVLVKKTVDLKDGDVGIFSVDNDMYCKQYCQDHIGNVYLFSLNRKRKDADITIRNDSGQTLWYFGKVLMKKRVPLPMGRDI
jgi:repressor LexA